MQSTVGGAPDRSKYMEQLVHRIYNFLKSTKNLMSYMMRAVEYVFFCVRLRRYILTLGKTDILCLNSSFQFVKEKNAIHRP